MRVNPDPTLITATDPTRPFDEDPEWEPRDHKTPPRGRMVEGGAVMGLILALLVLWLVFVVVGFAFKALLWLAIIGIVLFITTGVLGALRGRSSRGVPR